MHWRYLTIILSVFLAAALTVAVAATIVERFDAALPAWAIVVPLALVLLLRRFAR
ncbi:hypothetical protein OEW28_17450 [Defluviimonas sp. WL0002]|uniref:Uncharacterized protein n=1 Tax=Albidovulum marisflavi TaxID=2984159 RepID=A0ABT2ZH01_9RHOB|nr:hypothetical protein [Defluviimonas sp. WL0002]MCV2870402.1 hypothetical protein [Defluviimonas sp. WL0002]